MDAVTWAVLGIATVDAALITLFSVWVGPRIARKLVRQDATDPNGPVRRAVREEVNGAIASLPSQLASGRGLPSEAAAEMARRSAEARAAKEERKFETEAYLLGKLGEAGLFLKKMLPDLWAKALGFDPLLAEKFLKPAVERFAANTRKDPGAAVAPDWMRP